MCEDWRGRSRANVLTRFADTSQPYGPEIPLPAIGHTTQDPRKRQQCRRSFKSTLNIIADATLPVKLQKLHVSPQAGSALSQLIFERYSAAKILYVILK